MARGVFVPTNGYRHLHGPLSHRTYHVSTATAPTMTTYPLPGSRQHKIEALADIWSFADLIGYKGGAKSFSQCHKDMTSFLLTTQQHESFENRRRLVLMPRGHGKAQSLDSLVQTPCGPKRIGDLQLDDNVIGMDGKPTQVTVLHPVTPMDLYRVTTSDGRSTLCNLDHLWTVTIPSNSRKQVTVTTRELLTKYQLPRYDKRNNTHYIENRVRITPAAVVGVEDTQLPIDPYTLGMWLGDGTSAASTFTCHDDDAATMGRIGCYKNNTKYIWTLPKLVVTLKTNNLYKNKHIPEQYYLASYAQRMELLRGLMDSDGTCNKYGAASFGNSNTTLMADFVRLVRSLGGKAHVCSTHSTYPGANKVFPTQQANIWVPDNPFWLDRKAVRWVKPARIQLVISDIQLEKHDWGRCITVANSDGLYLTDDYIPTHNSSICSVLYTMWRIYRNPNIRILVGTNIKRLARGFIRELRQYFENKELQEKVWNSRPHIDGPLIPVLSAADRRTRNSRRNNNYSVQEMEDSSFNLNVADDTKLIWSGESLQMTRPVVLKEPTVQVASVGTIMTGDHYDLLILDDVVDFDNSNSQDKADNLLDWTRDLESVIDPRTSYDFTIKPVTKGVCTTRFTDFVGDEVVTLGTMYFEWDFYHYLQDEAETLGVRVFKRNVYVNGVDEEDGYLWPERFNKRVIDGLRRRINNSSRFSSQYLNAVIAPEDATFSLERLKWFPCSMVTVGEDRHVEVTYQGVRRRIKPKLFMDPAATTGSTSDFSVLGVGGYDEDRNLYILDLAVGRYTPTEVCTHMFRLAKQWRLNSVTVEMVGGFKLYRHVITEELKRRKISLGIEDYRPTGKINKQARIEAALEPHFANETLYISSHLANTAELRNEITTYPKSKHDDVLDVMASLVELAAPVMKKGQRGASTPRRSTNSKWGGTRG